MHKRGARGAAANRNAVIMDAQPATVVQQREGTNANEDMPIEGNETDEEGQRNKQPEESVRACFARSNGRISVCTSFENDQRMPLRFISRTNQRLTLAISLTNSEHYTMKKIDYDWKLRWSIVKERDDIWNERDITENRAIKSKRRKKCCFYAYYVAKIGKQTVKFIRAITLENFSHRMAGKY